MLARQCLAEYNNFMPAKNTIKQFVEGGYYHIYNRGVEKRKIFMDNQDYLVCLSYLKTYLMPKEVNNLQAIIADPKIDWGKKDKAIKLLRLNNFSERLSLLAYCLMPNHFHFLVKQTDEDVIDNFMNSLFTRYSMYFNRKYRRVGKLFQGVYKAVLVNTDEQLLHLSRYIHRNPISILQGDALQKYSYSSYGAYLKISDFDWVKSNMILSAFSSTKFNSYKSFVEDKGLDYLMKQHIGKLTFDE